jgi:hypothetical protein
MPPPTTKLRSRSSFRQRFWTRSGANDFGDDIDADDGAPSSTKPQAYVPKHAASDFSRVGAKPSRPSNHRHSYSWGNDEATMTVRQLTPIKAEDGDGGEQAGRTAAPREKKVTPRVPVSPQRAAAREDGAKPAAPSQPRMPVTGPLASPLHRPSQSLSSDPWDGSRPPQPEQTVAAEEADERQALVPSLPEAAAAAAAPAAHESGAGSSDYQAFMAQAAAEDQAHRAAILRTLSQRSHGYGHAQYPVNGFQPATVQRSATQRTNKHDSAYYSASGNPRASGVTTVEEHADGGHATNSNRSSDNDGDNDNNNNNKDAKGSAANHPVVLGGFRRSADGTLQQHAGQPQGLRRKGSITKKVADYIRPPRPASTGPEAGVPATRRQDGTRRSKFAESVPE